MLLHRANPSCVLQKALPKGLATNSKLFLGSIILSGHIAEGLVTQVAFLHFIIHESKSDRILSVLKST